MPRVRTSSDHHFRGFFLIMFCFYGGYCLPSRSNGSQSTRESTTGNDVITFMLAHVRALRPVLNVLMEMMTGTNIFLVLLLGAWLFLRLERPDTITATMDTLVACNAAPKDKDCPRGLDHGKGTKLGTFLNCWLWQPEDGGCYLARERVGSHPLG